MATRCLWCGLMLQVPPHAQSVACPGCKTVIHLPRRSATLSYGGGGGYRPFPAYQTQRPSYLPVAPPQVMMQQNRRRRAVLCGITYQGHKKSLKGSVNNVSSIRQLLVSVLGFPPSSILVLTENERDPSRIPTKANIRESMNWLVRGCQPGDSLVFYYSGHASQVIDRDGDEVDGIDESICPLDYETEGKILDDEINAKLVRPLTHGVTLHAIMDTCFSGTSLDLPFVCRMNREGYMKWEDHRNPYSSIYKGTSGGTAISISACDDDQNSADTTAFTGSAIGALTYSFIKALNEKPKLTYGQLLVSLQNLIAQIQEEPFSDGTSAPPPQVPQLSSSERFDIHSKIMTL
ncbi:unnamed protein product [Cuscuta campestris]|uniref:Peptidase C14 caspase domain-containing protein n=1 Tax=Cuscuta campestris TaxID=132261 RepID=A0A484LQI7_9ASTE|nr:unnamed protein product [Cuscuta campestris]